MSNVIITAFRYSHHDTHKFGAYNFLSCRCIKKLLEAAAHGVMKRTPWSNEWKGEPFYNFLMKVH